MAETFPVLTRSGGRCDDCKKRTEGTLYIASRDPDTDEVEIKVCFVHMKRRLRQIKMIAAEMNIVRELAMKEMEEVEQHA